MKTHKWSHKQIITGDDWKTAGSLTVDRVNISSWNGRKKKQEQRTDFGMIYLSLDIQENSFSSCVLINSQYIQQIYRNNILQCLGKRFDFIEREWMQSHREEWLEKEEEDELPKCERRGGKGVVITKDSGKMCWITVLTAHEKAKMTVTQCPMTMGKLIKFSWQ